jgi:4-amino-4-deoxy-L-arabinose transferase-like glycosyltransferase
MLAVAYRLFGPSGTVGMVVNALLGAAAAYASYRLVDDASTPSRGPAAAWRPMAAGLVVALHPALVPYTAAIMTEGITAAILVVAAAFGARARTASRAWPWLVAAGGTMGLATLVRPQSLVLAPVLGALAVGPGGVARVRLARAAVVTALAVACVAPWTARNCVRMHRCALVSVNGGWNLLIGVQTQTGAYERLDVPAPCATVWDEAAKDACFEEAAHEAIVAAPLPWLARVPAKLAATFDYFGAGPWYLHDSNAAAFDGDAKLRLGAVETVVCRLLLLGALVACGRRDGPRALARKLVALGGAAGAVTVHGWLGYVAVAGCVAMLGRRAWVEAPLVLPWTAAAVAATAVVHAVFFGAGRYGLVVVPLVATIAFVPGNSSTRAS